MKNENKKVVTNRVIPLNDRAIGAKDALMQFTSLNGSRGGFGQVLRPISK